MSSGGRGRSTSERRARGRPGARPGPQPGPQQRGPRRPGAQARRLAIGLAGAALAASGLAACGTAGASSGPVSLSLYLYPDNSGATQQAKAGK